MVDNVTRTVRVLDEPESTARAGGPPHRRAGRAARRPRGRFVIAFSGGRTPVPLFRALADLSDGPRRWASWELFCCDERCVPRDDERSNLGLARELWLEPSRFPSANVHPVETSGPPEEAARRYDAQLRTFFGTRPGPTFDAVVLGVGPDGHTASLFPGSSTLGVTGRWAVAELTPQMPPPVPRVTLTLEALGRARTAVFLVCGSDKRAALAQILLRRRPPPATAPLPAARVVAVDTTEWFIDRAAAPPGAGPGTDE